MSGEACAFCLFRRSGFFAGGAHAAPLHPPAPAKAGVVLCCFALLRLAWIMCRNSAPSSAFSGERGTGIAPRLPHPGDVSPPEPPRSSLCFVATLGLCVIKCVSAPPLSSIPPYEFVFGKRTFKEQKNGTDFSIPSRTCICNHLLSQQ